MDVMLAAALASLWLHVQIMRNKQRGRTVPVRSMLLLRSNRGERNENNVSVACTDPPSFLSLQVSLSL